MSGNEATGPLAAGNAGIDIPLQEITDGVEDALLVIDSDYRVRFANSAVRVILHKKVEPLTGRLCYEILHERNKPCSTPLWECPLKKVFESGKTATVIHPVRILGTDTYLKITGFPLRDSHGNIRAMVEVMRDITAERELEREVLKRHHQLLALSYISSALSGLQDLDSILKIALDNVLEIINGPIGGILLLDEEAKSLYYRVQQGLSARYTEEMRISVGEGIAGWVAETGKPMLVEDLSKDLRAARPDLVNAEGIKGFVSIPLKAKERVVGVMNVASHTAGKFGSDDISLLSSIGDYLGTAIEQASLHERLTRAGERYRALLQHALTAQEEERKRIARELHDETSQAITSSTLSLHAIIGLAEMKGIGDAEFMERLKTTHSYLVHTGNEIVKLMKALRPTLLDELGMAAAIHRYAKDALQPQGINVSTEFEGADQRFQPEVEVTLFRVAQGLIGNILEHSEASNTSIRLECNDSECVLHIEDDGKGFDVSKLIQVDPSGRGAGLFTMKERVRLVGGNCQVESQPGRGTQVTVKVPIAADMSYEEDFSANS
ncbi:MAG: GAF domain-containing protein [Dehalococcoidales bacterium]|nr:MAG: GAF domain-containing protein [Dehalococcoidales bacterium]